MDTEIEIDAAKLGRQTPRLCRYLSERSPQAMIAVVGATHIVSYLNPAFARLVGREAKDLLGRPFVEAAPEEVQNGCLARLDRVFRTGIAENLAEQMHLQSQPRPVYWSYAMWAILGEDEQPVGVMIQVTDATEIACFRRQSVAMNESLLISATQQHEYTEIAESLSARLQDAVNARDHFLAILSHELRNPLAAVTYGLRLLKRASEDGSKMDHLQGMMERQIKQMAALVDDLLDVSRIATGKLELHKERVELASIVQVVVETSRALMDEKGHKLTLSLPSGPVWLNADPHRLAQVFVNLLSNAAKYSEPCGNIRLTARFEGAEVEVIVQDSGIGIPSAQLPHVFEAFVQVDTSWQRAQGGMGIGLSLVKKFIELHGGRVEARSEGLGLGSEFLVRLPIVAGIAKPTDAAERPEGPRRRILVVDDNRDAADSLTMLLEIMGHEARTAYDGETGAAMAAEYRPELVLMDLGMPKVDGFEAARRIRAQSWKTKMTLVALTGWGDADVLRRTREAGFDQRLVKPVDSNALIKIITEMSAETVVA